MRKLEDLEDRGRRNESQQRQLVEEYLEARSQRLSISIDAPKEVYRLMTSGASFEARNSSASKF